MKLRTVERCPECLQGQVPCEGGECTNCGRTFTPAELTFVRRVMGTRFTTED